MKYMLSVTVAVVLTAFSVQSASAQPTTLTALRNADLIRLVALRVSDQTVVPVINDAKITQFDLCASAVSELTVLGGCSHCHRRDAPTFDPHASFDASADPRA